MKALIISILAVFALASYQNYEGKWTYQDEYSIFSVTLLQKDSVVTGDHCSVMSGGNRVDDGEKSIEGVAKKDHLLIKIKSGYGFGTGTAKLTFVGKDSLHFEMITPPKDEYWIPDDVILTRSK